MQWLLSHITLPNKPTFNERSLHHISKVYHLDASPSTNYILNDVQCYVGLKDAVEVQQPLSYRELAELFRTSTCFLNYRDTHGRKRG